MIGAETAFPELMAEDHLVILSVLIFSRTEGAAQFRTNSQESEIIRGHGRRPNGLRFALGVEACRVVLIRRSHLLKDVVGSAPGEVVRDRNCGVVGLKTRG